MKKTNNDVKADLKERLAAKNRQRSDLEAGVKQAKAEAERLKAEKKKYADACDEDNYAEVMTQIQFFENLAETRSSMLSDLGKGLNLSSRELAELWTKHLANEEPALRSLESRYLKAKAELLSIYREMQKLRQNLIDDSTFFKSCGDQEARAKAVLQIPQAADPISREMYAYFRPQLEALGISMLDARYRFDWFALNDLK